MEPKPVDEKRARTCEVQLVDMIRTIQRENVAKGIFRTVSDTQLGIELLVDAYRDPNGIGFEVFARTQLDARTSLELGTVEYKQAVGKIIEVVNPYLDSLVAKGELIRDEIPQDETGSAETFYWVTTTAIMGS